MRIRRINSEGNPFIKFLKSKKRRIIGETTMATLGTQGDELNQSSKVNMKDRSPHNQQGVDSRFETVDSTNIDQQGR